MPRNVLREEVQELQRRGAVIAEVLPESEYRRHHLAGAISLPLARLAERAAGLPRETAIVVYCHDHQ